MLLGREGKNDSSEERASENFAVNQEGNSNSTNENNADKENDNGSSEENTVIKLVLLLLLMQKFSKRPMKF